MSASGGKADSDQPAAFRSKRASTEADARVCHAWISYAATAGKPFLVSTEPIALHSDTKQPKQWVREVPTPSGRTLLATASLTLPVLDTILAISHYGEGAKSHPVDSSARPGWFHATFLLRIAIISSKVRGNLMKSVGLWLSSSSTFSSCVKMLNASSYRFFMSAS
jgi:hypothetical protein